MLVIRNVCLHFSSSHLMRLSAVHKPFVTSQIFTTSDLTILKTAMCFKGNFCVKSSNSVPVVYMYAKFLCFV